MSIVAIVDYGMCNLDSVARAIEECGGKAVVTASPAEVHAATHVILPGVGAFTDAMAHLAERKLIEPLREVALERKMPFLGICLGMQLMARYGHEGGGSEGLGMISAEVKRLQPDAPGVRIPHIGWNEVEHPQSSPLLAEIPSGKDFYFVHSFAMFCDDEASVVARTPYCGGFVSIARGGERLYGVQFHPEKSQKTGFRLLRNFLSL
jgi:imidazole glycerol-phosphate synthase subunit HisH